jgi:DNA primase small subunit
MHCWVLSSDTTTLSSPDSSVRAAVVALVSPPPATVADTVVWRMACASDPWAEDVIRALLPGDGRLKLSTTTTTNSSADGMFLGWYADRFPGMAIYALRHQAELLLSRTATVDEDDRIQFDALARVRMLLAKIRDLNNLARSAEICLRKKRAARLSQDVTVSGCAKEIDNGSTTAVKLAAGFHHIALAVRQDMETFMRPTNRVLMNVACMVTRAALDCLMPRIDVNVATEPNHLLKAPLSVHPDTHRLALPVKPDHFEQFTPSAAPVLIDVDISRSPARLLFSDQAAAVNAIAEFNKQNMQ